MCVLLNFLRLLEIALRPEPAKINSKAHKRVVERVHEFGLSLQPPPLRIVAALQLASRRKVSNSIIVAAII